MKKNLEAKLSKPVASISLAALPKNDEILARSFGRADGPPYPIYVRVYVPYSTCTNRRAKRLRRISIGCFARPYLAGLQRLFNEGVQLASQRSSARRLPRAFHHTANRETKNLRTQLAAVTLALEHPEKTVNLEKVARDAERPAR